MKMLASILLFAMVASTPEIRYFHYQRSLQNIPPQTTQACAVIDPEIFAHASSGLADLRLYRDSTETPYLLQTSGPASASTEQTIALLNLGSRDAAVVFDAAMPAGAYNDLQLKVDGHDFIATVAVKGSQDQTGRATTIGSYTIFDLTRQRLGRSTILHLPTSDFRFLHFTISGPLRPDDINGLSIQQVSASHPAWVTVAQTTQVTHKGHSTLVEFSVPAHVPVDRVVFTAPSQPANFSRDVIISAAETPSRPVDVSAPPPESITSTGNLLRVHTVEADHKIDLENLEVDTLRSAFDQPSRWTISIDNGDNPPLLPTSVRLEMYERDLCFQSSPGNYTLFYGDATLNAPRYDIGQFLVIRPASAAHLTAGPEQQNSEFQPRPDSRPFTERHPALLWITLAIVIALLGIIAVKSARPQKGTNA